MSCLLWEHLCPGRVVVGTPVTLKIGLSLIWNDYPAAAGYILYVYIVSQTVIKRLKYWTSEQENQVLIHPSLWKLLVTLGQSFCLNPIYIIVVKNRRTAIYPLPWALEWKVGYKLNSIRNRHFSQIPSLRTIQLRLVSILMALLMFS